MIRWPAAWVRTINWFVSNTETGRKFERFVWWLNGKLGGPSGPTAEQPMNPKEASND